MYEISGSIEVDIYGCVDRKINRQLETAIRKAIIEVCKKEGSVNDDEITFCFDGLEYEKEEE